MVDLLAEHPILLLAVVVGVGSALGRLGFRGFALGPAAVLFLGLAVGGYDERLVLGEDLQVLGLVLFTYTVGLATGPAFAASLRGRGLRSLAVVVTAVALAAVAARTVGAALGLSRAGSAGVFTGALTNTPALGAVVDHAEAADAAAAAVGYSLAYPAGVIGALLAAQAALRRARREANGSTRELVAWTVAVTVPEVPPLGEVPQAVTFSRIARDGGLQVATPDMRCVAGDLVTVIGPDDEVRAFTDAVGERAGTDLAADRSTLDFRRVTVSSSAVVGRRLAELQLDRRFGATVTRLRRGDIDIVARPDLVLEPGDRVRVVAPVDQLRPLAQLFGDSEHALAEINFVAVAAGLGVGVALGLVPFPGGIQLGAAGGTLVAGLVLGATGRLGPVTFTVGHQASLALRQLGTVLFLAAVGTRSGPAFAERALSMAGLRILVAGVVVTAVAMAVVSVLSRRWLRLDGHHSAGAVAGAQTQPAVLAFAEKGAGHDPGVAVGYTSLYPAAMVVKIVAAQILART